MKEFRSIKEILNEIKESADITIENVYDIGGRDYVYSMVYMLETAAIEINSLLNEANRRMNERRLIERMKNSGKDNPRLAKDLGDGIKIYAFEKECDGETRFEAYINNKPTLRVYKTLEDCIKGEL